MKNVYEKSLHHAHHGHPFGKASLNLLNFNDQMRTIVVPIQCDTYKLVYVDLYIYIFLLSLKKKWIFPPCSPH